jgi:hypothetical protein
LWAQAVSYRCFVSVRSRAPSVGFVGSSFGAISYSWSARPALKAAFFATDPYTYYILTLKKL